MPGRRGQVIEAWNSAKSTVGARRKRDPKKLPQVLLHVLRRGFRRGFCPICEKKTFFYQEGEWLRDQLKCPSCGSIPRERGLIHVLEEHFPDWRDLEIHESSPDGASSDKMARECRRYLPTHYFPETPTGEMRDGWRCENLESLTLDDDSFDLTITQDVLEHVLDPARAFAEIGRTLRPGGAHVFTVPWFYWKDTLVRACIEDGEVRHLEEPDFHGDPLGPERYLVTREWGRDLCAFIHLHAEMTTTVHRLNDRSRGLEGEFLEVFISRKASR